MRAPSNPPRRTAGAARLTGKPLPRLDLPAKSDGSFRFAADVRLPGMLFAAARIAPPGGRLTGFSRAGAGGHRVVVRNAWLAVAADNWWAAERALQMANPHFEGPAAAAARRPARALRNRLDAGDWTSWFSRGDYAVGDRGIAAARRRPTGWRRRSISGSSR